MLRSIRIWLARKRLERLIAKRRRSYEVEAYRRHREAAKLGWQRRRAA